MREENAVVAVAQGKGVHWVSCQRETRFGLGCGLARELVWLEGRLLKTQCNAQTKAKLVMYNDEN